MAINVLMAKGLDLPSDFYFWGQNHGGSLIPLLGNFLVEAYKFPPVMAVSVIHYFLLIAGFFALTTFFKDRKLKLILALIWFFPCWHFLGHLTLSFGIQISLIAIALYVLKIMEGTVNRYLQLLWLSIACLIFITAIWVSDMTLIPFSIIVLLVICKYWQTIRTKKLFVLIKEKDKLFSTLVVAFWLILGTAFILYAKHRAFKELGDHSNHLNHPGEILASVKIILYSFWRVLIFGSENVMESIYAWSILIGFPFIIALSNTRNQFANFCSLNKRLLFFTLNGIVLFVFLVFSHQVQMNGTSREYFSIVYISLWIALLLYVEATGSHHRQLRLIILLIVVIFGALSSFNKFYFPKQLPSQLTLGEAYEKLGDCGLIAGYQNSYLTACVDPKHIVATPHDKDRVRNYYYAESVFKMPRLYLVKNGWLTSFPDTITQFGHILIRKGKEFQVCNDSLCEYERMYFKRTFSGEEMQHQGKLIKDPSAMFGKSVVISKDFDRKKHFIYGPFLSLKQGTILVQYNLKSIPDLDTRNIAVLEISAEYGKKILASMTIRSCDFQRENFFQLFNLKTTLDKDYNGIEFRIMYLGGADLYFDYVGLTGM